MLKKAVEIAMIMLLIPLCLGFTWRLGASVFSVPYKAELPYYFIAGGFTYLAIHFIFRKPILTYVFAHELTHAFFAVLFGGSVKAFKASERGGQVTVTKSNFVITLAPYFFPLYTFLVLILYLLTNPARKGAAEALIFLAGMTFCFHIVLTAIFLRTDQKDILEHGVVFSYSLIYLFNVIFAGLLVNLLLARENGFLDFLGNGIIQSIRVVTLLLSKLWSLKN